MLKQWFENFFFSFGSPHLSGNCYYVISTTNIEYYTIAVASLPRFTCFKRWTAKNAYEYFLSKKLSYIQATPELRLWASFFPEECCEFFGKTPTSKLFRAENIIVTFFLWGLLFRYLDDSWFVHYRWVINLCIFTTFSIAKKCTNVQFFITRYSFNCMQQLHLLKKH